MPKTRNKPLEKKYFSKYKEPLVPMPDLLETQIESYKWLMKDGVKETLKEFSPIKDYSEKKFELSFESFTLGEPKHSPLYVKENKLTYEASLKVRVKLLNRLNGSVKEQEVFFSDFPLMTKQGTFIINGVERVIVPQLTRSSGVFFTELDVKGRKKFGAKIIPNRGVWIEFETDKDNIVYARIDKKRKFAVTTLMKVLGLDSDDKIRKAFKGNEVHEKFINQILDKDSAKTPEEAYVDIYKRLRDGDMATADNAKEFIDAIFTAERYDFSAVGRHRFNSRFEKSMEKSELARLTLNADDIVTITKNVFDLNTTPGSKADDIDHLGRRRVRYVGELLQQKFRVQV
jgi:DNA-directed RNA polymerase subunit beta